MRSIILLLAGSPGTIGMSPDLAGLKGSSLRSNRSLALRPWSSGPWHLKQLSERMGRISRLKPIVPATGAWVGLVAASTENASGKHSVKTGNSDNFILQPADRKPGKRAFRFRCHRTHLRALENLFLE